MTEPSHNLSAGEQKFALTNRSLSLFLVSFVGLFLELLLIRWIATEVNIFAYLQNTVLVVCFLGFGIGCMTSQQPIEIRLTLVPLLVLVLLLAVPDSRRGLGGISRLLSTLGDLVVWEMHASDNTLQAIPSISIGMAATFVLMMLICTAFVPIGRILGRLMNGHPEPIRAYSINIAGSLFGTWCFTLLSAYYQPPFVWFLLFSCCIIPFVGAPKMENLVNYILLVAIVTCGWFASRDSTAVELLWSPYQKLALQSFGDDGPAGRYDISVNNSYYLSMSTPSEENIRRWPSFYPPEMSGLSQYDIPPLLHANPQKALIVGSGGGNDIAGAVRNGVKEITAVEIDPAIIQLGRKYHNDRPYSSRNLSVVNDDARSFFSTTNERYDLIIFGLLDSHTTTSMTNARLDHYVYTDEALRQAKQLLARGGIVTLAFEAQKSFIADRIGSMLRAIFGHEPLSFRVPSTAYGPGGRIFVVGNVNMVRSQLASNPRLSSLISTWQAQYPFSFTYRTPKITDDWPYLYLPSRSIPSLYYLLAILMAALYLYARWRFAPGIPVGIRKIEHWHFFFLGAGFLLLEVQNISKAAVVLGNTWSVNVIIISGILIMILFANLLVSKIARMPMAWVYFCLITTCVALYFIDLSQFGLLPYWQKAALVAFLAGLPILFSGFIFAKSFAKVSEKSKALGANLVGAMVGGLLQSLTFIIGIKALLLIVAAFYLTAWATAPSAGQWTPARLGK